MRRYISRELVSFFLLFCFIFLSYSRLFFNDCRKFIFTRKTASKGNKVRLKTTKYESSDLYQKTSKIWQISQTDSNFTFSRTTQVNQQKIVEGTTVCAYVASTLSGIHVRDILGVCNIFSFTHKSHNLSRTCSCMTSL